MTKYREILRLTALGLSQRNIIQSIGVSQKTIVKVQKRAKELHLSWSLDEKMTDAVKKALLERYPTPFYTFDAGILRARVAYLKAHLPQEIELCYAVKANTFISPYIADMIDRYEVCSPGELAICTEQEIAPEKLVISGVYKTPELIEGHIASDNCAGHYTAESLEQFALLKTAAHETGKKIKILLRLTSGNQFGMNEEDIENIVKAEKNNAEIDICGIQFFSGTQKTSLKKYKREITHLSEFLNKEGSWKNRDPFVFMGSLLFRSTLLHSRQ